MENAPFTWRRGPRSGFILPEESGVYALFLRKGAALSVTAGRDGLIYIGMAHGAGGLKQRCHFSGRTKNHSPRKSLTVLLMEELKLSPVLIPKRTSSTWGLDAASDAKLTAWMHDHLDLAFEVCAKPAQRETELLGVLAPPLNLTKCVQSSQHRLISAKRSSTHEQLKAAIARTPNREIPRPKALAVGRQVEASILATAISIARDHRLDPKALRRALRLAVKDRSKFQRWSAVVGSPEHRIMMDVAKQLAARSSR